jgi:hypothetical protein
MKFNKKVYQFLNVEIILNKKKLYKINIDIEKLQKWYTVYTNKIKRLKCILFYNDRNKNVTLDNEIISKHKKVNQFLNAEIILNKKKLLKINIEKIAKMVYSIY